MDSLNIDNRSKALTFKKFKRPLHKYYPKFVKTFKKHPNKFDIRQFLVILFYFVPNIKNYYSIDRLLKNANVLQAGTGKNPTTPLYSDTKKSENVLNQKDIKMIKRRHAFKGFASAFNVEILSTDNLLQLTDTLILNLLLEMS